MGTRMLEWSNRVKKYCPVGRQLTAEVEHQFDERSNTIKSWLVANLLNGLNPWVDGILVGSRKFYAGHRETHCNR